MQRFVKFVSLWAGVILLFIGCVYVVNAKAEYDNDHLRKIDSFFLSSTDKGETFKDTEQAKTLMKAFKNGLRVDNTIKRNEGKEIPIQILFSDGMRIMAAEVNCDEHYMATQNGTIYHISEEFAGYVKEYYETGRLMGITNIMVK